MASRWDTLFDRKPVPLAEHLLSEAAALLEQELHTWPLPLTEMTAGEFAPLFEPSAPRPTRAVFLEAFSLARLELQREFAAVDDYLRNQRYLERGLAPTDRLALRLVTAYVSEQLLSLAEATQGRLRRPDLIRCLDLIAKRFEHSPVHRAPVTGQA